MSLFCAVVLNDLSSSVIICLKRCSSWCMACQYAVSLPRGAVGLFVHCGMSLWQLLTILTRFFAADVLRTIFYEIVHVFLFSNSQI